jgi:soluble lytic murein transglycosylase-like protein/prefoldin subunit 5
VAATLIDSLFVSLGLDASAFQKGAKQTSADVDKVRKDTEKASKDIEAAGKRAANFFGEVKNQALALAAVFMGGLGLKDFISQTASADAASGRLAANLGMTTRELDAWRGAARRAGDTAEGMDSALQGVSGALQHFSLTGTMGDALGYFYQMGVRIQDANGKMRPASAILLDISKHMETLSKTERPKAVEMMSMLGMSGITNTMLEGQDKLQGDIKAVYEIRKSADDAAEASQRLARRWAELKDKADELGDKILLKLQPTLDKLLDLLDRLADWGQRHPDLFAGAIASVSLLGTVITGLIAAKTIAGLARVAAGFMGIGTAAKAAAAAAEGGAGAGAATAAGRGLVARLLTSVFGKLLGGAALYFHTDDLNSGEDAAMALHRADSAAAAARLNGGGGEGDQNLLRSIEQRNGLPAGLLDAQWTQESGRSHGAIESSAGAKGPFQFMDGTAKQFGLDGSSVNDFGASASAAGSYLSQLMKMFGGDTAKALAGYNWGAGNVQKDIGKHGADWLQYTPSETQKYVASIMGGISRGGGSTGGNSNNSSTSEVNIQTVNVHTAATDADGIARDMKQSISSHGLVAQANTGLS